MNPPLTRWIADVAPYVVEHIKAGMSEQEAIEAGMADYSALLNEVCDDRSERVKALKKALRVVAFAEIHLASI